MDLRTGFQDLNGEGQAAAPVHSKELVSEALSRQLERKEIELPLLPQVSSQVLTMAGDDRSSAAKLSKIIHQDQALAGNVLKVANSAAFGGRTAIVSLQQAIARLGMNPLREIALSLSVKGHLFQAPGYESVVRSIWRHALASGIYAKEIARMRRRNVEIGFLCGLLHAIGKPLVLGAISRIEKQLGLRLGRIQVLQLLDDFHPSFGARLAEEWGLPEQVRESIKWCESYRQAPAFAEDAENTFVAGLLATHCLSPGTFEEEEFRNHQAFRDLNLYPDDIERLILRGPTVVERVEALAL
ncbi:MAG: HDOD domain-containing protein [Acidobacteriota bacterium]